MAEATSPDYSAVYCSGFFTDDKVPAETRLISGEQSSNRVVFASGDHVFISKGSAQGVRVGDRFSIVREVKDPNEVQWFKWQGKLMKAMGARYLDTGQVEIINVQPNCPTAVIRFSCDYLQRGDIAVPFASRPSPPYKSAEQFNPFAPVSGKSVGMLVAGLDFANAYGKNSTVFVNLGTNQGVKVGDYFRIFRYQGSTSETVANFSDYQYSMYGFGSTPVKYQWNDLPREVAGRRHRDQRQPQRRHHVHHLQQIGVFMPAITSKSNNSTIPYFQGPRFFKSAGLFYFRGSDLSAIRMHSNP